MTTLELTIILNKWEKEALRNILSDRTSLPGVENDCQRAAT